MLKDKVLIAVSTRNTNVFLDHFIRTFEKFDPGYPCDLLIVDEGSTNTSQLRLLERLSKKYMIRIRDNTGRAQGTYEYVRANFKDQYQYYFLMHNDSAILRSNWLKVAVDRMEDNFVELGLEDYPDIAKRPVGKVGFQGYKHSALSAGKIPEYYLQPKKYRGMDIRGPYPHSETIFQYTGIESPKVYQLINDDRHLWSNDLFSKIDVFWNIEEFRKRKDTDMFQNINNFYNNSTFTKIQYIEPKEVYSGANWEGFQGVSEFMTSLAPYRFGFRTHCVLDEGTLQEEVGWSRFWGLEFLNHYGSHNFYKRMSLLHKIDEGEFRKKLNNEAMLTMCDKIVKAETDWVEKLK